MRGGANLVGVMASCFMITACAAVTRYEAPSSLRGYQILITREDSLSDYIARGLRRRGFKVRKTVKGGSPPTAYLITFTFREPEPEAMTWLHVRLADTRNGVIVAAVSAPLDSLGQTSDARAGAVVDSLVSSGSLRRPDSPP